MKEFFEEINNSLGFQGIILSVTCFIVLLTNLALVKYVVNIKRTQTQCLQELSSLRRKNELNSTGRGVYSTTESIL